MGGQAIPTIDRQDGAAKRALLHLSRGLRVPRPLALLSFMLAATLFARTAASATFEDTRFVAQLELTDLQPRKVAFAPDDASLLLVVNDHGRIDLIDISNPGRPAKITEIAAA